MSPGLFRFLVLGVVAVIAAGFIAVMFIDRGGRIIGARRALPAGTRVTLGDVVPLELPAAERPEGGIGVERAAKVIGATLVRDVGAGVAITEQDLVLPGRPAPARGDAHRPRRTLRLASGQRLTRSALARAGGRRERQRASH